MPKPANKPIIAVDIDDVISNQNENIRLFINRRYGHDHTPEDYLKVDAPYWHYWAHVWEVTKEEHDRRVDEYNGSEELVKQPVAPGAIEALKKLKQDYELVIITSRKGVYLDQTHQWLDKHFKSVFSGIHFSRLKEGAPELTKASICKDIGASYLIDDNPGHCNLAAETGVQALLFGFYGWNKNAELHPGVKRVRDWPQVLEYFDGRG